MAEWLGRGLQSLVHQFESGRRLLAWFRETPERGTPPPAPTGDPCCMRDERLRRGLLASAALSGAGIFIAFTGVVLLTAATAYALASGIYVRLLPIAPLLLQCIVTVILFPVLERPLAWVDRSIGRSLRATI